MVRVLALAFLLLISMTCESASNTGFAEGFGSPRAQTVLTAVALDRAGNVLVAGYSFGEIDWTFGNIHVARLAFHDNFVAKLDPYGAAQWVRSVPADPSANGSFVALGVDDAGNSFAGSGNHSPTSDLTLCAFYCETSKSEVLKIDPAGVVLWNRALPHFSLHGLQVDPSGGLFVAGSLPSDPGCIPQPAIGTCHDTAVIVGGAPMQRVGPNDTYVAKIDSSGAIVWERHFGAADEIRHTRALAVDNTGATYVTGLLERIDPQLPTPPSVGGHVGFVFKLDGSGNTVWSKTFGTGVVGRDVLLLSIAVDGAGSTFLGGSAADLAAVDPGHTPTRDTGFVMRLDAAGNPMWSKFLGSRAGVKAVTLGGDGLLYLAGDFFGEPAPLAFTPKGFQDAFAVKLDTSGNELAANNFGGSGGAMEATAVAVNAASDVYLAGYFERVLIEPALTALGDPDGFLLKTRLTGLPIVEFHHAAFDHYFVSSNPEEVEALDTGRFEGWARTGERFQVLPLGTAGASDVCRFFSAAFAPKSSHFYTASESECATLKQGRYWQFEGTVFSLGVPSLAGACPTDTQPIYRLYNNGQGDAPNHRYTTSITTRDQMVAVGWTSEGYGTLGVMMCAPAF